MPAFDILKKNLEDLPFDLQLSLFYGIHNLKIDPQILGVINPSEIVAKYIGARHLKKRNAHLVQNERGEFVTPTVILDFPQLIRKLDGMGYQALRGTTKDWKKPFGTNPGQQVQRLGCIDDAVKSSLMASFFRPENESVYHMKSYGKDQSLYVRDVYNYLKRQQEKLEQSFLVKI